MITFKSLTIFTLFHLSCIVHSSQNDDSRISRLEARLTTLENSQNTAKRRLTTLENTARRLNYINVLRTCNEYKVSGLTSEDSGLYLIDPDGANNGYPPFEVYCDFASGETVVHHVSETSVRIPKCQTEGCFRHNIDYRKANMNQLAALIELSESCEQNIAFKCYIAPLYDDGVYYGKWIDGNGKEQIYFAGSNFDNHICDCALTANGCSEPGHSCNCDASDPVNQKDTGKITHQQHLPIRGFTYYGLKYESEKASFSIGPLQCKGAKKYRPGQSCYDLKLQGETRSGYYQIWSGVPKGDGQNYQTVFCDFSQRLNDAKLETDLCPVVLLQAVYELNKDYYYMKAPTRVSFNKIQIETLPGFMNLESGIYTVPISGSYSIRLQGLFGDVTTFHRVQMRLNGIDYDTIQGETTSAKDNISFSREIILNLTEGDTLDFYLTHGELLVAVGPRAFIYFNLQLLY